MTAVKPAAAGGTQATAEVELKYRNVPSCDVKVYPIDLLKFSLLKRNLGGITQINLAGIRPLYETTIQLGDGKDYADKSRKLPLPLVQEGAYLVVCRGEELYTSGLVLVTPLAVEVQEDAASGRVRATVKNSLTDRYQSDVQIKVIGSRNGDFISGATDLRGVFVADGIQGTSTVIARLEPKPAAEPSPFAEGVRYAFFRGKTDLVPTPPQPATAPPTAAASSPATATPPGAPQAKGTPAAVRKDSGGMGGGGGLGGALLEGVEGMNLDLQHRQVEQLKQIQTKPSKGVEAQKAY